MFEYHHLNENYDEIGVAVKATKALITSSLALMSRDEVRRLATAIEDEIIDDPSNR